MELNKIVELEARLGMNLDDIETAAVVTYLEGGNSPIGMDYMRACEITDGLMQRSGFTF